MIAMNLHGWHLMDFPGPFMRLTLGVGAKG